MTEMKRLMRLMFVLMGLFFMPQLVCAQDAEDETTDEVATISKSQAKYLASKIDGLSSADARALKNFSEQYGRKLMRRGNRWMVAGGVLLVGGIATSVALPEGDARIVPAMVAVFGSMGCFFYGWLGPWSSGARWKDTASKVFVYEPLPNADFHIGNTDLAATIGILKENGRSHYAIGPTFKLTF